MKKFLFFVTMILLNSGLLGAQMLYPQKTRWIGANIPGSTFYYASPCRDGGVILLGTTHPNAALDIPQGHNLGTTEILVAKLRTDFSFEWIKQFGTSSDHDEEVAIRQSADGGYGILASTVGNDGDITSQMPDAPNLWLIKIDSNGNKLWDKCYGGPSGDSPRDMEATPDGGFIMTAMVGSPAGGDIPFTYSNNPFLADALVIKVDSIGTKEWSRVYGGTADDGEPNILIVPGGYILGGSSFSHDNDITDSSWHPGINMIQYRVYMLGLSSNGDVLWNKTYGGLNGSSEPILLYDDRDFSILFTASAIEGGYMTSNGHGYNNDCFIVKTDMVGNVKWHKMLGTSEQLIMKRGFGITKSQNGGYINLMTRAGGGGIRFSVLTKDGLEESYIDMGGTSGAHLEATVGHTQLPTFVSGILVAGHGQAGTIGGQQINPHNMSTGGFITYLSFTPNGVRDADNSTTITIHPNPGHGKLQLQTANIGKITTSLSTIDGRLLLQHTWSGSATLDVSGIAPGLYLLKHVSDGTVLAERVVIQ